MAGAILAGPEAFIEKSKVWKRRYGGDLICLYPYIISADYYLDKRLDKMETYYKQAKELAKRFNNIDNVYTIPEMPVSNMFHVHFYDDMSRVEEVLRNISDKLDLGFVPYLTDKEGDGCRCELSIGDSYSEIPKEILDRCFNELNNQL